MKKISATIMGLALVAALIYTGCKKDVTPVNPATPDTDYSAAQDEANASFMLNDSKNIADGAAQTGVSVERVLGGTCGTVTGDSSATADTIDIHFSGLCPSPDGRYRKGDIIVYWTSHKGYFDSGATVTQTWKNYSVTSLLSGTISISGTNTVTNTGKDSLGDHSWSCSSNVTLNYSTGGSATWKATRNNVLTKVGSVYYYVISGSAIGTSKSGVQYSETISGSNPLYWTAYFINGGATGGKFCDCIEAGSITFSCTGKPYPLTLTFTSGVGTCAHTATANINGTNYPFTIL
jgi:hypothetical protein